MRGWKVVGGLLGFWLMLFLYMSSTVLQNGDNMQRAEHQLDKALQELDQLRAQNTELRKLANELKEIQLSTNDGEKAEVKSLQQRLARASKELRKMSSETKPPSSDTGTSGLSLDYEKTRRKVESVNFEFWNFIRSKLKKLLDLSAGNTALITTINEVLEDASDYRKVLKNDLWKLRTVDGNEEWRMKESKDLGELVQKRLRYLQNPKDCSTAKKLVCNLSKGCGYGCQLHHVVYCLILAYSTERTLILESSGWRYASGGWETVFQPLSDTCVSRMGQASKFWGGGLDQSIYQIVELPIVDSLHPRPPQLPLAIPEDLAPRLLAFHGNPPVWWIGQMVIYLTRLQPAMQEYIDEATKTFDFKNPVVGVHVRRTDKLAAEASFHSLDEYMKYVEEYYNTLEERQTVDKRRVYLASDDATVLADAKQRYSNYDFISDNEISKLAGLNLRYTDNSLKGIILDIHFLSRCNYLVCTFSSQVCRVAYEIMQTMHGDASDYFRSLDDIFYFGGQNGHEWNVLYAHSPRTKEGIHIEPGDSIGIAGNHWDGYSKGVNRRTGATGLFPTYKTEDKFTIAKFPTYPNVR